MVLLRGGFCIAEKFWKLWDLWERSSVIAAPNTICLSFARILHAWGSKLDSILRVIYSPQHWLSFDDGLLFFISRGPSKKFLIGLSSLRTIFSLLLLVCHPPHPRQIHPWLREGKLNLKTSILSSASKLKKLAAPSLPWNERYILYLPFYCIFKNIFAVQ